MSENHFNQSAADWDSKPMRVQIAETSSSAIRREVPWQENMRLLDFGCGTGLLSMPLAREAQSLLAVDTADNMLSTFMEKALEQGLGDVVKTQRLDFTQGELPEPGFELIVSSMTLHHIADTAHLLTQFYDLLTPGGYIALADLAQEDGSFHRDNAEQGVVHFGFAPETLEQQAQAVGFSEVRSIVVHTVQRPENYPEKQHEYPIFLLLGKKPN